MLSGGMAQVTTVLRPSAPGGAGATVDKDLQSKQRAKRRMKHQKVIGKAAPKQSYCAVCGRTSDDYDTEKTRVSSAAERPYDKRRSHGIVPPATLDGREGLVSPQLAKRKTPSDSGRFSALTAEKSHSHALTVWIETGDSVITPAVASGCTS
jgi:hypothetical protein